MVETPAVFRPPEGTPWCRPRVRALAARARWGSNATVAVARTGVGLDPSTDRFVACVHTCGPTLRWSTRAFVDAAQGTAAVASPPDVDVVVREGASAATASGAHF